MVWVGKVFIKSLCACGEFGDQGLFAGRPKIPGLPKKPQNAVLGLRIAG
jgi:hypothetical protein